MIALATPPIVSQGFSDFDNDNDVRGTASSVPAAPSPTGPTTAGPFLTLPPADDGPSEGTQSDRPESAAETEGAGDGAAAKVTAYPTTSPAVVAVAPMVAPSAQTAAPTAPAGRPREGVAAAETGSEGPDSVPPVSSGTNPGAEQATILRLIAAALLAAAAASLVGLFAAARLVAPLTRLEVAATGVARGDLSQRSGLAGRSDEFGQLGRTFDSMAGQLEQAEESRRRFLQDAAHELKTPLAVIEATSSAIIDGVYSAERRHVETIRDQSRVLARIVDDLRTISLAEGGHLPLEKRPVNVAELLRSVATAFGAKAATASVELSVAAAPELAVGADPDRLRQIVGALVDNAIRYVKPGGHIRLLGQPAPGPGSGVAARGGRVRILVEDDGPGFPAESVDRIFERFYQADASRSRGDRNSGLGLSIVKAMAEAHGGTVGAENRPTGGARIWLDLPEPDRGATVDPGPAIAEKRGPMYRIRSRRKPAPTRPRRE